MHTMATYSSADLSLSISPSSKLLFPLVWSESKSFPRQIYSGPWCRTAEIVEEGFCTNDRWAWWWTLNWQNPNCYTIPQSWRAERVGVSGSIRILRLMEEWRRSSSSFFCSSIWYVWNYSPQGGRGVNWVIFLNKSYWIRVIFSRLSKRGGIRGGVIRGRGVISTCFVWIGFVVIGLCC